MFHYRFFASVFRSALISGFCRSLIKSAASPSCAASATATIWPRAFPQPSSSRPAPTVQRAGEVANGAGSLSGRQSDPDSRPDRFMRRFFRIRHGESSIQSPPEVACTPIACRKKNKDRRNLLPPVPVSVSLDLPITWRGGCRARR